MVNLLSKHQICIVPCFTINCVPVLDKKNYMVTLYTKYDGKKKKKESLLILKSSNSLEEVHQESAKRQFIISSHHYNILYTYIICH